MDAHITVLVVENRSCLVQLEELVKLLSDEQLSQPMPAGWTVSAVLAHLAFWDIRIVTLLNKWAIEGVSASSIDSDVINEVTRQLFLEIPPRIAAELALHWGQVVNQAIEELSSDRAAEIQEKAPNVRLDRAHHRQAHIIEIKTALGI
jgi:hypothetical protein